MKISVKSILDERKEETRQLLPFCSPDRKYESLHLKLTK